MRVIKIDTTGEIRLKLPIETVILGPGTVPTSGASVGTTSIPEMSSSLRKASKAGLFDDFIKDERTITPVE